MAVKTEKIQILTWLVGTQLFGMELGECREVVQDRMITAVPHAKKNTAGIVNLRGDVVTVMDLAVMLGYEKKDSNDKKNHVIIRLKGETQQLALKADSIYDIMEIDLNKLEAPPAHLNELETRYISGVSMTEKGLVVILNPEELLSIV